MNVFDAVKTMLAVRSYQNKPIPAQSVTHILEAARLTGSSRNRQAWDFVVIQEPQTLKKLGELASSGSFVGQAALAIAVVITDTLSGHIDGARASQDMMLTAWEEGIGSNWVGNANTEPIRVLLNIPADRMVLNLVAFGYPAQAVGKGIKRRKALAEIVHRETFGRPYREAD